MKDKELICTGQKIKCNMAAAPFTLMVLPIRKVTCGHLPVANIMDNKIGVNILPPVCVCKSPMNPAVVSMIVSTYGATTQAPSAPLLTAPWVPGNPQVMVEHSPALTKDSKLICAWGGIIEIS